MARILKPYALYPEIIGESEIKIPGVSAISGWSVETSFMEEAVDVDNQNEFVAYLDADKCGGSLTIRSRIYGDRFQPLGFDTPKRLNRFMIDLKIPQSWRERVPLVCCDGQVI